MNKIEREIKEQNVKENQVTKLKEKYGIKDKGSTRENIKGMKYQAEYRNKT